VLGHRVLAPSTLGTFLRSFTFGHVRQLDRVLAEALRRAWSAGAGPGSERLVIDIDSFVCEVHGAKKQGAAFGYTQTLGYHPLIATRASTLETLHIRMRRGSANTQRGAKRFLDELIARVRRAGATGEILVRADSGFWSYATISALERLGVRYSIGVTMQAHVRVAIEQIPQAAWQPLAGYPATGLAEIAETLLGERRLVVRRTRLVGAQAALWPDWRHHAFITNRTDELATVRGRASPARRRRARHPRPQRLRATTRAQRRPLRRQRRLVRNRSTGRQPRALGHAPGTQARHATSPSNAAPAPTRRTRPARAPRRPPQPAPTRALALAAHLDRMPHPPTQPATAPLTDRPPASLPDHRHAQPHSSPQRPHAAPPRLSQLTRRHTTRHDRRPGCGPHPPPALTTPNAHRQPPKSNPAVD
jgi:hypothetical protein